MAEQPTTYGAAGFDRALGVLEFDKVCAMLADCAHTEGARRAFYTSRFKFGPDL